MAKIMTKAEESAIVDQIEKLINSTEANSYVRFAFAGCVKLARDNIEYDFGNSYPDMLEFKDKEIEEARRDAECLRKRIADKSSRIDELSAETIRLEDVIDNMENELTSWSNKYANAEKVANAWEEHAHDVANQLSQKDAEIMRLKAEIYDLRKECGK